MKHRALTIITASSLFATPALAAASVITHTQFSSGQNNSLLMVDDIAVNVQTAGGNFASKTVAGFTATGISGGKVSGEIDGSQAMTFSFDQPTHINSLTIGFLYAAGNFGDVDNEMALFTTDFGSFTLEATGATTSLWDGYGNVVNESPGVEGHGGMWSISGEDIFGGPVTFLTLSSGNAGNHGRYGDFSFRSMAISAVPAPGALVLLAGAFSIGRTRRR